MSGSGSRRRGRRAVSEAARRGVPRAVAARQGRLENVQKVLTGQVDNRSVAT